jgi:hypothetical protein
MLVHALKAELWLSVDHLFIKKEKSIFLKRVKHIIASTQLILRYIKISLVLPITQPELVLGHSLTI